MIPFLENKFSRDADSEREKTVDTLHASFLKYRTVSAEKGVDCHEI